MSHVIPPIALQLYTVRDCVSQDMFGTLEQIAAMGYEGVEFAGFFDHSVEEIKKHLDKLGLVTCGIHTGLDLLISAFGKCVTDAKVLGTDIVVVPYLAEEYRGSRGYRKATATMIEIADKLKSHDIRLAYHNHNFEFAPVEPGSVNRGMDIITQSPADKVLLEIDVYWVLHGGVNPLAFLKRHISRAPLLHMKDMLDGASKQFTEIGRGILDFHKIVEMAVENNVEWLIIEQDSDFTDNSMESAKHSLKVLHKISQETAGT